MELRRFIEQGTQTIFPTPTVSEKIEEGRVRLFNFDYPFFDPEYKSVFETNFIRQFYFKEIGFDVFGRFQFELENYLRINMGYYNKLFESELIKYEILENYKLTEEYKRNVDKKSDTDNKKTGNVKVDSTGLATGNATATGSNVTDTIDGVTGTTGSTGNTTETGTGTNNSTSNTTNDEVVSDTPQALLSNKDYATGATFTDNKNTKTGSTGKTNVSDTTGSTTNTSDATGKQTGTSTQTSNSTDNQTTNQTELNNENLLGKTKTLTVEDYILTKTGKVGERNYPKMVEEYRNTLLRIELQIFKEMNKQLFMLIYNY